MSTLRDKDLGKNIKCGDEIAFKKLYDRYHAQMYYIAKQYLKRPTLAEDAVQDVFVKLWNKRERIESSKPIRGLLFVMLKNHLINLLRKRKNDIVPISKENEGLLKSDAKSDQDLLYKEFHAILEKGLEELSDRKREVFELRTINGHTNSEVADLLHIDIKTVKTHYYLSSKFIRAYLKTHAGLLALFVLINS